MDFWIYVIVIIVGYLLGCIQSSYIIGRMSNIDIREHGSKNAGASNAVMTLGWKKGIIVGLVDILKAAIPVFILTRIFPEQNALAMACGVAVVVGHIFPVFMKFKGGKGTASIIGTLLGLNPLFFVVGGLFILAVTLITDFIAIGTLAMHISLLVSLIVFNYNFAVIWIFVAIVILNLSLHIPNFKRIKEGSESRFSGAFKKKSTD